MPVPADAALVPHDVPNRIDFPSSNDEEWLTSASDALPPHRDHCLRVAAELKALGRPFPRALELGSGPGELAETVLHEVPGLRLVCLDLSEGACREAPADLGSKEGRMTCVTRSLFDPGWADGLGRFDAVIVGPALHERHPGPGKVAFYARVRTLLLPGGILLLCDRATGAGDPRNAASLGVEDALGEAGWNSAQSLRQGQGQVLLKARP